MNSHRPPPPRPSQPIGPPSLNPLDLFRMVLQRWYIGLTIGLLASGAVAYTKFKEPKLFQSEATLVVELNPEKMIQLSDVGTGNESQRFYEGIVSNYLERLKSRSMADFVQANLSQDHVKSFLKVFPKISMIEGTNGWQVPRVASQLQRSTSSSWNSETQIVSIRATNKDAHLAQAMVEAYCDAFILLQSNRSDARTSHTLDFLQEQSRELQSELEKGESLLQKYRSENNLLSLEGGTDLISQRLSTLNQALTEQTVSLIDAKTRLGQITPAGESFEALQKIPFIANRPRVSELTIELERERTERSTLSQTYGSRHPIMLASEASLISIEQSLGRAVRAVAEEIQTEIAVIEAGYKSLEDEVKEVEKEALEFDRLAIDYRVLQRNLSIKQQVFNLVSEQFTTTDVSSQFDTTSIIVLDPAYLPGRPFSPDPKKIFMFAGFIFIASCIGIPILLEFLDNRLKSFADIENYLGKPVFGDIKRISGQTEEALAKGVSEGDKQLSEAFRTIYSSLKLETGCEPPFSLLVTSSVPSEGKTFVACNLAQFFSRHQLNVLLIDCDFRRPSVHRQFGIKNKTGVIQWTDSEKSTLEQTSPLEIESLGIKAVSENLHILTSGGATADPTEVIENKRFKQLIEKMKQSYDAIIIDTSPSGLFPDAALLCEFSDHTLFVARQNAVQKKKALFSVNRIEATSAPVIGIVLNGITSNSVTYGAGSYCLGYEKDSSKYEAYYKEKTK